MGVIFDPFSGQLIYTGPGGGVSPSGQPYKIERVTLTPTDIANKQVTLSAVPAIASETLLTVIGGPMQDYLVDYQISGSTLSWSGLTLDGILLSGDKLVIMYN